MNKSFSRLFAVLACGALVWAQGAGVGANKPTKAQEIRDNMSAGPGYVQEDFLTDLGSGLSAKLGDQRGNQMMSHLQEQQLDESDSLKLVNGDLTKSQLKDLFGANRGELDRTQEALDGAVKSKNKKMFFGIMIFIMVIDFDTDPTAEFTQQVGGARDEIGDEAFGKLCKGNVSTGTIEDAFGFTSKDDQKFMQQILNALMSSPLTCHPMCQSLGIGDPTKFDPKQFPQPQQGMPGIGGNFDSGMAGGLPFDKEMPPCPFMGGNLDKFFGGGEDAPAEAPAGG